MKTLKLSALAALPFALAAPARALTFDFGNTAALGAQINAALAAAGDSWSSRIADNITVKIDFSLGALPSDVLGSTGSFYSVIPYATYHAALAADAKSALDASAIASLEPGTTYTAIVNGVANQSPIDNFFAGLDSVAVNTANQHAIGLLGGYSGTDAAMTITDGVTFDFDPSDGITPGSFDFVGVVTHELGHALGFDSGVDTLEDLYNATGGLTFLDYDTSATSLDLFRYTGFNGGTLPLRNLGLGNASKFFSVDGGATFGAQFATGELFGDGNQASHWKDGLGLGVMDPTANPDGSALPISFNDLSAFDAIGYDLKPVPEPATFVVLGGALAALARRRRR